MLNPLRGRVAARAVAGQAEADFELEPDRIIRTANRLRDRIDARFPGRGIGRLIRRLEGLAEHTMDRLDAVRRPLLGVRLAIIALIAAMVTLMVRILVDWQLPAGITTLVDLAEVMDAATNEILLVGAGLFFLVTIETRVKRSRALRALRELRALAHIIDMHQLTKDPTRAAMGRWKAEPGHHGADSRESGDTHEMAVEDLESYLDYCSEMLSIVSKLAALYAQNLDDAVVLSAVDEVEGLASRLSSKIWQKIIILGRSGEA